MNPLVTINLVVRNGEKYLHHCLDAVKRQTYTNIELNILDNDSTDRTKNIIEAETDNLKIKLASFSFHLLNKNLAMWGGQEELLKHSSGKYTIALSVDILMDEKFVEESVRVMERDPKLGMLQAKIFQYQLSELDAGSGLPAKDIDTVGFKMFRSREVNNIGHGEEDKGQYDKEMEIFGVEGAVPVFRREAIEDSRILGEFTDLDFFWYGDDIDFAWRMRLFGWGHIYAPSVIAHHDRQTTKRLGDSDADFVKIRQAVPMLKRRLDWRNHILMLVKNDYASNFLRDLPYIAVRQFKLKIYFFVYEPEIFLEFFTIAKLLPRMLQKRREIMRRAKVSPADIRRWFK